MPAEKTYKIQSGSFELAVDMVGVGPPVIYAHGLTGNRHVALNAWRHMADRYRIIVFDQRGHHDSTPVVEAAQIDPLAMAADIGVVLDALDIKKAIVGGESMGAATALLYALHNPQRVEALLLTAPAFGHEPNPSGDGVRLMGQEMARLGMVRYLAKARERQQTELGWNPGVIDAVAAMQGSHQADSLAIACQSVAGWRLFPDLTVLTSLQAPVYIVAWPDDELHPYRLAEQMVERLPYAQLVPFPPLPEIFLHPEKIGTIYDKMLHGLTSEIFEQ